MSSQPNIQQMQDEVYRETAIKMLSIMRQQLPASSFAHALRIALGHDDLKALYQEIAKLIVRDDPQLTQQLYDLLALLPKK